MDELGLTLPHPYLFERAFVLVPLAEIAPDRVIAGRKVRDALAGARPVRDRAAGADPVRARDLHCRDYRFRRRLWHFPPMTEPLVLAAEFPPTTEAEWRHLVDAALKGASFDKKLVSQTYDGLRIEPLYPPAAGAKPVARPHAGRAHGRLMQRVDHPDPADANKQALIDLENGATGLSLVFAGSIGAYGYGLGGAEQTIARALDNVWLDAVAIETDFSAQEKEAGLNLAKVVKARGIDPARTQIRFAHDPLGLMARNGAAPRPWAETAKLLAGFAADLAGQGFSGSLRGRRRPRRSCRRRLGSPGTGLRRSAMR